MKFGGGAKISLVIILTVIAIIFSIGPLQKQMKLGLDLQGGAEVVMQAKNSDGKKVTKDQMTDLKEVIDKRVNAYGVTEPIITITGDDRLTVDLAGIDDPDQAIELLGQTAKLEFKDPDGNVILTGKDLEDASGGEQEGKIYVSLKFTKEGQEKFAEATARLVGKQMGIYLDGNLLTNPSVNEPIMDGQASISGGFTELEEAINLASNLRGGSLPVDVEILSKRTVGPSLGQDSLQKSLFAIAVGMSVLCIFMIAYYRLPGVLAIITLAVYGVLLLWTMNLFNVVLTLPGIAGFVLSFGMAVDANIIIYERMIDELKHGKSLLAGINAGYDRALWTIIDANVTTLIAAIVLYIFGTGPIRGFAVTLTIGLIISMLTSLILTKYLLIWSADVKPFRKRIGLYGAKLSKLKREVQ